MQNKNMISIKLMRATIPLLTILLIVSPMRVEAGLLDTVNNKVTNILNRVKNIMSNTNGLGDFINTMKDVRGNLGNGMISDMQDGIADTQNLIQFIKDRRESAGQTSQYPSLPNLVRSLDGIADVLVSRNGQGGALEGLSLLLDALPDKALAPVARVISKAGIDGDFVYKIDQMATNLVDLRDTLDEIAARRHSAYQVAGEYWIEDQDLYRAEFDCPIHSSTRLVRLSRAARAVKHTAEVLKISGSFIETITDAVEVKKGVGIWGWVNADVEAKPGQTLGKLMVISAEGALFRVSEAERIIGICRDQFEIDLNGGINGQA